MPTTHPSSLEGICPAKVTWTRVFGGPQAHPAHGLGAQAASAAHLGPGPGRWGRASRALEGAQGREQSPLRWGAGRQRASWMPVY